MSSDEYAQNLNLCICLFVGSYALTLVWKHSAIWADQPSCGRWWMSTAHRRPSITTRRHSQRGSWSKIMADLLKTKTMPTITWALKTHRFNRRLFKEILLSLMVLRMWSFTQRVGNNFCWWHNKLIFQKTLFALHSNKNKKYLYQFHIFCIELVG